MTLLDWFSQNTWTQLFIIWCIAAYLSAWSILIYVTFFVKLSAGTRKSKLKMFILFLFAPVIIPYLLWIN